MCTTLRSQRERERSPLPVDGQGVLGCVGWRTTVRGAASLSVTTTTNNNSRQDCGRTGHDSIPLVRLA
ncbi:hypothetical protein CGGC5_v007644 [Colletotrichum fructicola Nara gc5]|uniref:Uncharacterized protein n=1 Tax=Colletotrichum fructicola (strain Nara gc5) TaxID=1213859 RepID=A0A7J6J6Y6_COLFN|nr:hypothetical protein CFRS1_v003872 [Colletotrichum fructicola]KAF4484997.1 hypothetical protein CGGC5_v007644 [Colletotrichum fructicola Nara gc5]